MKLHLESFICDFDEASEMVTLICTPSLESFINDHHLQWTDFLPDFVNEKMNQFVFCTQNKEWDVFVEKFYAKCEVSIVLHVVPTPDDFDVYRYFPCNRDVIQYIVFPEKRQKTFLMQTTQAIADDYFIRTLHKAISNPKESKVNSLYKLKMLWISLRSHGDQPDFLSHRRRNLGWFAKHFYFIYHFLYFHVIHDLRFFSIGLRTEFIVCSKRLLQEVVDDERDYYNNINGEYEESNQLPF